MARKWKLPTYVSYRAAERDLYVLERVCEFWGLNKSQAIRKGLESLFAEIKYKDKPEKKRG